MPQRPICREPAVSTDHPQGQSGRHADPAHRLTSDSLPLTKVSDYANNILPQKLSQMPGVGLVGIGGEQKPAIRVQVNPAELAARGIDLEDVRTALGKANVNQPKGILYGPRQTYTLNTNDQLLSRTSSTTSSSPIATARRFASAMSAARSLRRENELIAGWLTTPGRSFSRSSASPAPT